MWREPVRNDALSKEPRAIVPTSAGGTKSSSSGMGLAKRSGPPVAIWRLNTMLSRAARENTLRVPPGDWMKSTGDAGRASITARICSRPAVTESVVKRADATTWSRRSEEHTSELQSRENLVCRLLLEKKKKKKNTYIFIKKKKKTIKHQ